MDPYMSLSFSCSTEQVAYSVVNDALSVNIAKVITL